MAKRTKLTESEFDELVKKILPLKLGFEFLDDHVVITDEHGNILYANKAVERNTGFLLAEVLGKNPGDLWGGLMPKDFYQHMWEVIKVQKLPFVAEVQNKKKDGTRYWQALHISPILNVDGEVNFFIAIEPNITSEKEKERFRDEFVSVLGHQLKSPLTTIKWIVELLLSNSNLSSDQQVAIQALAAANESAAGLIGDLLVLGKINSPYLVEATHDVPEELRKIIRDIQALNPRVVISFQEDCGECKLKMPRIGLQVFLNLITNAAEYSDKTHGQVTIRLLQEKEDMYFFSVRNNGLSIPKADQGRIFSKFFRTEEAKDMKPAGSGLGLFIVKLLCDKLGWTVGFQSPPAGEKDGAEFYVRILKDGAK